MSDITDSVVCFGFACAKDLPDIKDTHRPKRRPYPTEVEVYSFPQGWGSTALGFVGIGGQAITTAQTTVVLSGCNAAVYFGRRLAYVISNYNTEFTKDLLAQNMTEQGKSGKYRTVNSL